MPSTQSTTASQPIESPLWLLYVILAGLGMVGPFATDTIFPAFQQLEGALGVDAVALQQLISVYVMAFAAMSLFHGPLSDAIGRKPVILGGTLLFVLASIGCALAPSLGWLLVGRALQGFSAGAGQILSRAMVRDLFSDDRAQKVMSTIAMIFGLAPAIAPIVGGWLLYVGDWRGIFWFLAGYGVLLALAVWLWLPETNPPENRTPLRVGPLFQGLWSIAANPDGRRLAFAGMFNFAGMWLYIASASLFVVGLLGKGEQDFWMLFVPMISGMVLGSWVAGRLAGRMTGRRLATLGFLVSLVGATINLALALFPATARLPWSVAMLPVYSFGIALAFPILTLAMLDLFPHNRGAASSVQSFVSLTANAIIAGALVPLIAVSLWGLALGSLTLTAIAWLFWARHLQVTHVQPVAPADPQAYEPTEEL